MSKEQLKLFVAETEAWVARELAKIELGSVPEGVRFESDMEFASLEESRLYALQVRTVIECEAKLLDQSENAEYLQFETVRGHCMQKYFDYQNAVKRLASSVHKIKDRMREFDGTEFTDNELERANRDRDRCVEQLDINRERLRGAMSAYRRVVKTILDHDSMERPRWSWINAEWSPPQAGKAASAVRKVTASYEEALRYSNQRENDLMAKQAAG